VYGSQLFVEQKSYFFAIFQKSMGKMHCFSTEGTHAANFWVVLQSDVITSALYLSPWIK